MDRIPKTWEARLLLYTGYMIDCGFQSATVKSYNSAIKAVLSNDGYEIDTTSLQLNALTRACRLSNDKVKDRLPIIYNLLELLLYELERKFEQQIYLEVMYKCLFSFAYFGMFRICELTASQHVMKVKDVHSADNKNKLKIYLFTSKTHNRGSRPQSVKIEGNAHLTGDVNARNRKFDPYEITRDYLTLRGNYCDIEEQFFIFSDGSPVRQCNFRATLKSCLKNLNLNPHCYDSHSFRIGRATDMAKYGYTLDRIKQLGRWRSNAVYSYLRNP